jgi:outer membrane phospholipase A
VRVVCAVAALAVVLTGAEAIAQTEADILVSGVQLTRAGAMLVEITILNHGSAPRQDMLPARIPAEILIDDRRVPVMLEAAMAPSASYAIPPGGFLQARYQLHLPVNGVSGKTAILSLSGGAGGYAFSLSGVAASAAALEQRPTEQRSAQSVPVATSVSSTASAKPERGNAFLGNLSSYAPIYAVYGPGTNSDGRLQISFKYQLFGEPGAVGGDNPFINGIHFAYTQRMFWDLGARSSPFRNVDYMPEIFYLVPATAVGKKIALGGQAGLRHESNGRSGLASRSLNTLYVQPVATFPVGRYTLSLGPRLSLYAGRLEDNPDIKRYRGNTGLFLEIGEEDGLRLTTNSRFNFASGKGATDAELSYPLDRIVASSLNLYIFGQAFAGYGENLLDYNRKTTRLRIGIGIVR